MKINENTEKLEISVVIISIEQLKKVLLKVSKIKAMKSVVCVCEKEKEGEKEKEKEGCKITVVVVVVMAISFFFLFYFYVLPK